MTLGELGELAVVGRRQVVADLADLLVDDVEVVDQPFGSGRDRTLFPDRAGQNAVRLEQDATVLAITRRARTGWASAIWARSRRSRGDDRLAS
jgi:hypothetical protein